MLVSYARTRDALLCGTVEGTFPISCEGLQSVGAFLTTQGSAEAGHRLMARAHRAYTTERYIRLLLFGSSVLLVVGSLVVAVLLQGSWWVARQPGRTR
jgi:hypothetical protein